MNKKSSYFISAETLHFLSDEDEHFCSLFLKKLEKRLLLLLFEFD